MKLPYVEKSPFVPLLACALGLNLACAKDVGNDGIASSESETDTEGGDGDGDGDGDGESDPPCEFSEDPEAFVQVSAGHTHTCGVRGDCSVVCWGSDAWGESDPPEGLFVQVEVGGGGGGSNFSCGLKTDGTIECWGDMADLGGGRFARIAAGSASFCAIAEEDGALHCLEDPVFGPPPAGAFVDVSVGDEHGCALDTDGVAKCWTKLDPGPVQVPQDERFDQVSAGDFYSCGLRMDGTVTCWSDLVTDQPSGEYEFIDCGRAFACGIHPDGTIGCWQASVEFPPPPSSIDGEFVTLSAGKGHACAVYEDGTLTCWGQNDFGQATPP